MFVELVYDKRNVEGLQGAREIILAELTKRVHQIFPDAEVRVKPMQANGLNSDASKNDREKLNRMSASTFRFAKRRSAPTSSSSACINFRFPSRSSLSVGRLNGILTLLPYPVKPEFLPVLPRCLIADNEIEPVRQDDPGNRNNLADNAINL